ncbi:ABC transporter substrate-binding protein [Streptacidiphilus sp. N1-12]|uniref:ABC transporter substrate-binding protein n=2 Tax=Streptacidiphilus alkalitolerans TaxID=3342712 RepID=A0ABV6V6M9_9ACTN
MPRQLPRRSLLVGGAGALGGLLAGCGSAPPRTSGGTSNNAATSPAPVPVHDVRTAEGQVSVPQSPQRVVVLDTAELDSALTLGVTPVGAARGAAEPGLPGYWPAARLAGISEVGPIGEPDLDLVTGLRPDLILSNQPCDGGRYESLSAIAPTVLTASSGYTWKQNFQTHAQALNLRASADLVTQGYAQQLSSTLAALGGRHRTGGLRVSLLRFVEGEPPRLYARQNFLGVLLADLGLARPPAQSGPVFDVPLAGTARLADADGSVLFYATYGDPAKAGTARTVGSADWQALEAVRTQRAFAVDDQLWFQGIGYTGANLVLAQLQKFLTA